MKTDPFTAEPLPLPFPNCYWVRPGQLLAGEYPGSMSRAEAMERVEKLLRAGVTSFIDLTEEGELPEYENLLPSLTEQQVRYRRLPILDHSLPDTPAHMVKILDLIDSELAAGRCVYVHCHAGIGRTGTTMGCHLIRSGLASEAALDRLQVMWRQCARSRRWATIPETDEQVEYVRRWRESRAMSVAAPVANTSRSEGAMIGLALGDALGTLVAVSNFDAATLVAGVVSGVRDGGVLKVGADTSMTRAVAESFLAVSAHDPADQMQRYLQWTRASGDVPVPAELKRALASWQWSKKPNAGSHDPRNLDPHSLARTLAVALFRRSDATAAIELAASVSRTTQQSPLVLDVCRVWVATLIDALSGARKDNLLAFSGTAMQMVRARMLKMPVSELIDGRSPAEADSVSDAIAVTRAAMRAFGSTQNVRDALMNVTTASRAASSAAALCGAIAGAHYGLEAIPAEWRRQLAEDAALRSLARHLAG